MQREKMNFTQYKSDEMFSSTQLIRKSKMIFDKLSKDDIEKAVILRDGKPSFLLMDFAKYEQIMIEYMELKKSIGTNISREVDSPSKKETAVQEEPLLEIAVEKDNTEDISTNTDEVTVNKVSEKPKLTPAEQEVLDKALEELENLDMDAATKKREELKEFWD